MRVPVIAVATLAASALAVHPAHAAEPAPFAPREVVAKFGHTVPRAVIDPILRRCSTRVRLDSTTILDGLAPSSVTAGGLPRRLDRQARNVFWLEITRSGQSVQQTLACLRRDRRLVFAQPNFLGRPGAHRADRYPNDPGFVAGNQWSLLNAGQDDPAPLPPLPGDGNAGGTTGTIDADVDAVQAWDLPHTDCSRHVVAVFDTGADLDHPDLDGNLWVNPGEVAGNGVDDEGDFFVDDVHGFDMTQAVLAGLLPPAVADAGGDGPEDTLAPPPANFGGHGTHVAGIIGAEGDNGLAVAGLCWQARLMILRIGDPGTSDARVFFATLYVVIQKLAFGQDVRVINMSYWGWGMAANPVLALSYGLTAAADILFVKIAGNADQNLDAPGAAEYPCDSPQRTANVLCVAASNNTDTIATGAASNAHSNVGPKSVDLAAPGENILSLALAGGTAVLSGTSMAGPHVAGVAALAFSLFPAKSALVVKADILTGAAGPPAASGTDQVKSPPLVPAARSIFRRVASRGRLRWPYTGDLGDAPPGYDTIASPAGGALHWDIGNEFFGTDSTPEVDAVTPPPLDQDPIINLVDTDFADHPIAPGNGNFAFFPPPPWAPGAVVLVTYDLCSDYLGIADADGGRYQGGSPDRTLFVNAWFDLDHNGLFTNDELLLEDLVSPAPPPAAPAKPLYPNVTINLQPVLPPPAAAPVFPPPTSCVKIASFFTVPPPGGTPAWVRFRVDYGEDVLVNDPAPLFRRDRTFPEFAHLHWARHGEVEDFRLPEVDFFPESSGVFTLQVPFGQQSVQLSGPTTIYVGIGPDGEAADTDGDGLDQVQTEMVQLELSGVSSLGPVKVRLRKDAGPGGGTPPSRGEIEELVNVEPGKLDLPPFAPSGTAESFFDVFFEVEIGTLKLHNKEPKRMRGRITHKPPRRGELYESPDSIVLYDEQDQPTGFVLTFARHVPDPEREGDPEDPPR